jgi:hypothetical protein
MAGVVDGVGWWLVREGRGFGREFVDGVGDLLGWGGLLGLFVFLLVL